MTPDLNSAGFFNQLVQFFARHSIQGILAMYPSIITLMTSLAIIDLCTTFSLYEGSLRISNVISRIIKITTFLFIIYYWANPLPGLTLTKDLPATIPNTICYSFGYAGAKMAGLDPATTGDAFKASAILDHGYIVVMNRGFGCCNLI